MANDTAMIAAIGVVATSVGALVWIVKFLMTEMRHSLDKSAKAHDKVAAATDKNTAVSVETLTFMKALNGKLLKAAKQTVNEQRVNEQVVEHQTVKK